MTGDKSKENEKRKSHAELGSAWATWLLLLGLQGFGAIILAYATLSPEYAQDRNLIISALILASVLQIISVIGMWFWKTWGLYMYIAVTFIQMAAHMVLTASVWVGFYDAIPLLITGYILNYKKLLKNFS